MEARRAAWDNFCIAHGLDPAEASADERGVACFVVELMDDKPRIAVATLRQYVHAITTWRAEQALPRMQESGLLKRVWRGYSRLRAQAEDAGMMRRRVERAPLTPDLLARVHARLNLVGNYEHALLWAALAVATHGCMRGGEFLAADNAESDPDSQRRLLRRCHVSWKDGDERKGIVLALPFSKTSQFRPQPVAISAQMGSPLCPVAALQNYERWRTRQGTCGVDTPLFAEQDGRPLSRARFTQLLRNALAAAGVPSAELARYTAISPRKGGAQALWDAGASEGDIKAAGRWRSSAYRNYIARDAQPRPQQSRIASAFAAAAASSAAAPVGAVPATPSASPNTVAAMAPARAAAADAPRAPMDVDSALRAPGRMAAYSPGRMARSAPGLEAPRASMGVAPRAPGPSLEAPRAPGPVSSAPCAPGSSALRAPESAAPRALMDAAPRARAGPRGTRSRAGGQRRRALSLEADALPDADLDLLLEGDAFR